MTMIRTPLRTLNLARTRFAFSPLWETVMSDQAVRNPGQPDLQVSPSPALMRPTGYIPGFLTPPPTSLLVTIAEEFDLLRHTDPDPVRQEVRLAWQGQREWPTEALPSLNEPQAALTHLAAVPCTPDLDERRACMRSVTR